MKTGRWATRLTASRLRVHVSSNEAIYLAATAYLIILDSLTVDYGHKRCGPIQLLQAEEYCCRAVTTGTLAV